MGWWTILDYLAADGTNEIRSWLDRLPTAAQVRIDARIGYLQITRVWPPQYISARRDCQGIYELKIVSSGVQYRPLGFYGPERREFTLLMGAIEKGGRVEPRDFCDIALERRKIVNDDRSRIVPHRFG